MAWPFDPLTTYIATTPPAIKAFDLNAFQTAINDLYRGHPFFGNGLDGAYVQAAGAVNLSRTAEYTTFDLTGTASLFPDGHVVRASQYIRTRGTSEVNARGNPGIGTAGGAGGGGSFSFHQMGAGGNGGAGGTAPTGFGAAGASKLVTSGGGSGGAGGDGAANPGSAGAGGVASLGLELDWYSLTSLLSGFLLGYNGASHGAFPWQGGSGGGGGGASVGVSGGGGGGGGGVIILAAPIIDIGAGTFVRTNGGNGTDNGAGSSGGGGGGGGLIILICAQLIENGTVDAAGGTFGIGSGGGGSGFVGAPGMTIRRYMTT